MEVLRAQIDLQRIAGVQRVGHVPDCAALPAHRATPRHQPFDQWLTFSQGQLFLGQSEEALPFLAGPAGSEAEVVRRYLAFRDALAPLGLAPTQVLLSSRLAWQMKLSNGITMQLGRDTERDRVEDRVARFVSVYPQTLARSRQRVDYVDLRYPNGFAVRANERASERPLEARPAESHVNGRA